MGSKLKRQFVKNNTFTMYNREFYDSKAYQKITLSTRNMFEFLLRERRYKGKGRDKMWINNGKEDTLLEDTEHYEGAIIRRELN